VNEEIFEDLVDRAREKDADAFGQLYDFYVSKIYRYIFYRVGNQADAEDLTEDVFAKAFVAIKRYQRRGIPFSAWLFRIAHNAVTDHHRARAKQTHVEFDEETGDISEGDVTLRQVTIRRKREEVQSALSGLTVDQQNVIVLRFYAGLSVKEVASFLDRTEESVKALQHRAVRSLGRILGEDYQSES
jgi:RNA polymerase sigma-70 factor (ECF subfamily)